MQIREIMHPKPQTVRAAQLAKEAFEIMMTKGFRHLPVVDDSGALVGVLSDRDIRNIVVVQDKRPKEFADYVIVEPITAGEIMTPDPVTVSSEDDVGRAAKLMALHQFGCLPVVDDDELVGIVTEVDMMRLLDRLLNAP